MNIEIFKNKRCYIFPKSNISLTFKKYLEVNSVIFLGFIDNNLKDDEIYSLNDIQNQEFDYIFILSPNHLKAIYEQTTKIVPIEKVVCVTFNSENLSYLFSNKRRKFFPDDFFFEVEVPDFQAYNGQDASHIFVSLLIRELLKFNQKIITIPTQHNNKEYFRNRKIKKNSLLFSYHSFGGKDIRKIHFKEGYFFDIINIDEIGYSGWSSLCLDQNEIEEIKKIDIKKARREFTRYKQKYINKNLSKYLQPTITEDTLPSNFIFIPLQIFNDSVMAKSYFEPIFWLKNLVEILTKNQINIVIKRHPKCYISEVEELLNNFRKFENITIYEGSIHSAVKKCLAVYTINSGVGFESLFHLKPVITFGEVDYQSATFNVKDFKDLENNLIPILTNEKKDYMKKFITYYMTYKTINISNSESISNFVDNFVGNYLDKI